MDEFTYQNIFETKGIEYIIVIVFLLILIPFWMALNGQIKIKQKVLPTLKAISAKNLYFPQDLFYSSNHLWSFLEQSGDVKIGMDHLLSQVTGEIKFADFKKKGERILRGELLAGIHQGGKSLKLFSPVSGEITAINPLIQTSAEWVGKELYSKGWLYKIRPSQWEQERSSFYLAEEAVRWSEKELDRFKNFLTTSVNKYYSDLNHFVLQDGGELMNRPLSELPAEIWEDFQEDFLRLTEK